MSHDRNLEFLNRRRIVYRRNPITDKPNYTYKSDNTELEEEYKYNNNIVKLLLLGGAKIDIKDNKKDTPIQIATIYGNTEDLCLMIDYAQHVLEIEEVKKEADKLMIAKVTKYENEILRLKSLMHGQLIDLKNAEEMRLKLVKELQEVKDDNKKLAKQIEDIRIDQGGWRSRR